MKRTTAPDAPCTGARGRTSRVQLYCHPMVARVVPDSDDTTARVAIVTSFRHLPLRIRMAQPLDDDELFDLCAANENLRIERTAQGELVIMSPTGDQTGRR